MKLIANLKFLFTHSLPTIVASTNTELDHLDDRLDHHWEDREKQRNRFSDFQQWATDEIGSIAESIAETRLPLHSSKVCIPCPDILEQGDWVTPAYFCNTCGIANGLEIAQLAYSTWKATHFDKEPTRSRHNEAYPVYPVGFLRDLINDRYADIINK